jgi:hypothetical protein
MIWSLWFFFALTFPYDYIIAYVDDDIILYSEFQKNYLLIKKSFPASDTLILKDSLLHNLINTKIIAKEAEKETISLKEKELEEVLKERLAKLKENPSFNEQLFEEFKEFFKNNLRQELLIQKLLAKKKLIKYYDNAIRIEKFLRSHKRFFSQNAGDLRARPHLFAGITEKGKRRRSPKKNYRDLRNFTPGWRF